MGADNKKILEEINKYCSPNSLLILDKHGVLRRLVCPFKVRVIIENPIQRKGLEVYVLAVKISDELLLLYLIDKTLFPYYLFAIIL